MVATLLNYVLAILMVLSIGALLSLSLVMSAAIPAMVDFVGEDSPVGARFFRWLDAGVSFGLLTLFFALVFRIMSGRRIGWPHVVYGSLISALLFTAGKTLVGLYLAYTSTASAYGAAGSLVVFLIWVYYSSQITFFGAELIQARRSRADWISSLGSQVATAAANIGFVSGTYRPFAVRDGN